MNDHDAMLDDVALYALGALDEADARRVREHIAQCEACAQEYRRFKEVAAVLPIGAQDPSSSPKASPTLKRRILRRVNGTPQRFNLWPAYALAAACLVIAAVFGGLYASLLHQAHQNDRQLARETAILSDMVAPTARQYHVKGGEIVKSGDRVYIAMRTMPAPPKGKVYQAWTLRKGATKVTPSVTFVPRHGVALLRLPVDARGIAAVAVSLEPAGGSKQPTSKPVFLAKLS